MRFLSRFQRLERARPRSTEAPIPESETERFTALESAAPLPEVHAPSSGRFEPPRAPEAPLELDRGSAAQPFVRCQVCGRDSPRGTVRCDCGARLDTGDVAAFNAALWTEHQMRQVQEKSEHHQTLERDLAEAEHLAAARRELGERLAQRVADQERQANPRLSARWSWPIGLGLLGWIVFRFGITTNSLLVPLVGLVVLAGVGIWLGQRRPPGQ